MDEVGTGLKMLAFVFPVTVFALVTLLALRGLLEWLKASSTDRTLYKDFTIRLLTLD
jgi:hypothetical protein